MSLRSAAAKVHKGLMNLEGDATDPKLQPHLRLVDDAYINDIEQSNRADWLSRIGAAAITTLILGSGGVSSDAVHEPVHPVTKKTEQPTKASAPLLTAHPVRPGETAYNLAAERTRAGQDPMPYARSLLEQANSDGHIGLQPFDIETGTGDILRVLPVLPTNQDADRHNG